MTRQHHETAVVTSLQVLGYLSPFVGLVGARVVQAVVSVMKGGRK